MPRSMHLRSLLLLGLCAAPLGCEDVASLDSLEPRGSTLDRLDFGAVPVGLVRSLQLTIESTGSSPLELRAAKFVDEAPAASFELGPLPSPIQPGSSSELEVRFLPTTTDGVPATATLIIETNAEVDGTPFSFALELSGLGVRGLEITPDPIDFGTVLQGTRNKLQVSLHNPSSVPIEVRSIDHDGVRPLPEASQDVFFIDALVDSNGEIDIESGSSELAPGATIEIEVSYAPERGESNDVSRWRLAYCDRADCIQSVQLRGRGTSKPLRCHPERLDFGPALSGSVQTATVSCENITSNPIDVGSELSRSSSPAFGLVGGEQRLEAYGELPLTLTLEAAEDDARGAMYDGTLLVTPAVNGVSLDHIEVPLTGSKGGPRIAVTPRSLEFGPTALGTERYSFLRVSNTGLDPLIVSRIESDVDGTAAYRVEPDYLEILPGDADEVRVLFSPGTAGDLVSRIRFHSNDRRTPELDVPVRGDGLDLAPCAYQVTPRLDFGRVQFAHPATMTATISNLGSSRCLVTDIAILPDPNAQTSSVDFSLTSTPAAELYIEPGEQLALPVRFDPTVIGRSQAHLGFYISSLDDANPRVVLDASGSPYTTVACQPSSVTQAGNPVTVSVAAGALGSNISQVSWSVVSGPAGGVGTPDQWDPDPPLGDTVDFLPLIVGLYTLQATATDDSGQSVSCTTEVEAEGAGLQVTLRWNGTGDVDLHLHDYQTSYPWFHVPTDCHYTNKTPLWDARYAPSVGANPALDVDNTQSNGPENIRIPSPNPSSSFTVGVHNYGRADGRTATLDIYCGGTQPVATYTSRPLQPDDFWKVASITTSSTTQGACQILPIDSYMTGAQAMSGF